ncbi:unnamed protein product, partial [Mesorhabditis spiculigera]
MFENTLINIFYHTLGGLGTVVSLFWMYLIVKKSPVEMKLFKWVLFRLALCDECFSLGMAVLLLPELCFPVPAGAVHGIAGYFGDLGAKLAVSFVFFSGVNIFTAINGALYGVKSSLSEKTFKAHQQMLMMIVAQNIYPLFGIMIPVLTFVVSYAIDQLTLVSNAFYKHTFLVLLLIYPLISFCCCVAFMKPYRDFCFPCFAAKVEDSREPTRSDTDDAIRRIEERRGNFLD